MFEILPSLTKENILSRVSELDIFRYYSSNFIKPDKLFKSDFRKEDIGSCSITNYKGKIIYRDFGVCESYDCFSFIQRKFRCSFIEALNIINTDFNLKLDGKELNTKSSKIPIISNEQYSKIYTGRSEIRVYYKEWDDISIQYLTDHKLDYKHVSKKFNVNPIDYFWINGYKYKAQSLAFAYYFGIKDDKYIYKIYQPLAKKYKWFHNLDETVLQGYRQLPEFGDILIISKAYKDVWNFENHNIPALSPGAEGWDIPEDIMLDLKRRFKRIICVYDPDYAGIKAMNKLRKQYNLEYFYIPKSIKIKDFADYCKANSYEFVQEQINKLI